MFTSRSEFRLILRAENSDFRLTQKAIDLNILSPHQTKIFNQKLAAKTLTQTNLKDFKLTSAKWHELGIERASKGKTEKVSA